MLKVGGNAKLSSLEQVLAHAFIKRHVHVPTHGAMKFFLNNIPQVFKVEFLWLPLTESTQIFLFDSVCVLGAT